MAEGSDDYSYEKILENSVRVYLPYIEMSVQAIHLLSSLTSFSKEQRKKIFQMHKLDSIGATRMALDMYFSSDEPGKYREFLNAMEILGYEKIVKMLEGKEVLDDTNYQKIIDLFTPQLVERLNPIQLLVHLEQSNTLSKSESEEIRKEEMNYGNQRASWVLLFYLPCREEHWFKNFMQALLECRNEDIAEMLDPDMFEKLKTQRDFRLSETQQRHQSFAAVGEHTVSASGGADVDMMDQYTSGVTLGTKNLDEQDMDVSEMKHPTSTKNPESTKSTASLILNVGCNDDETQMKLLTGSPNDLDDETDLKQVAMDQSRTEKETKTNHTGLRKYTPEFLRLCRNSPHSQHAPPEIDKFPEIRLRIPLPRKRECSPSLQREDVNRRQRDRSPVNGANGLNDLSLTPDKKTAEVLRLRDDLEGSPSLQREDVNRERRDRSPINGARGLNDLSLTPDKKTAEVLRLRDDLGTSDIEVVCSGYIRLNSNIIFEEDILKELNDATDQDTLEDTVDEDIQLKLRGYQKELAEEGLQGENVIVLAPTNTGKTWVGCSIMQEHMRQCRREGKIGKIVFVVENEALAIQQGNLCTELLSAYRTKVISGRIQRDKGQYLRDFLDKRDILVVTAMVLVNCLNAGEIENLTVFSMLLFDECHHANDDHPYNQILIKYLDLKLARGTVSANLPQIVGLTASLGVGGNRSDQGALQHMQQIMANMDAKFPSTVKTDAGKREMEKYQNPPFEEIVEAPPRKNDAFRADVEEIMEEIDNMIENKPCMLQLVGKDLDIRQVFRVPNEKGNEQFIQWISNFKKKMAELRSTEAMRFLNPCRRHLEVYNKALMIHKDARVQDALNLLEDFMEEVQDNQKNDATDQELLDKFSRLTEKSYADLEENPKLVKMQQLILTNINENGRGIIFVRTKELAKALIDWLQDTDELTHLNATKFVGQNASASSGGMTKSGQIDVLQYFKNGRHKVIVATSVAEEGLDITKCNLVIRYEHVTNEIVRLQSRGRARAEGSNYFVLTETGSWIVEKEALNAMLEEVMNRVIPVLQRYVSDDSNNWEERILQKQKEIQYTRRRKIEELEAGRTNDVCQLQCLNCSNFICMSDEIRKIQDAHRVVITEDVKERLVTKRSPIPAYEENELQFHGHIYCKECHQELGGICEYKHVDFPLLKISNFRIVDKYNNGSTVKKWKKVKFIVRRFTLEDLAEIVDQKIRQTLME